MGKRVVVTAVFSVEFDVDSYRWDPTWSDDRVVDECVESVRADWEHFAIAPDTIDIQGEVVA
jgi:hypothetical protein